MARYRKLQIRGIKIYEHRLRAEVALGRSLHGTECVHHANDTQLVICPDQAYHLFLHMRTRTVQAGGNPNTEKYCAVCRNCKPFDAFMRRPGGLEPQCRACRLERGNINQTKRRMRNHQPTPVKTHCKHGHEFTEANSYFDKEGYRSCRTCHREQTRQKRQGHKP